MIEKSPKGKSRRAVAIGPAMVKVLREHKARQNEEKAKAGLLYHDYDYVFPREDGEPYYPRYFTDTWEKACIEAGVPEIVLHDARHTSATAGADAGVPEHVMQKRLGHADARTTREVYTNPRELHQTGEKLLVGWPGRRLRGLSSACGVAA